MIVSVYTAIVFLTAAGALVLEIVAGRLIAPYIGMSLYTWTAIIAVVLAGLSVGHWIGGRLAGREIDDTAGARRIAWALAAAAVSTLASLVLLRALSGLLLGSGLNPIAAVVTLTTALFFLPSLFAGIVSPIITKLAIDREPEAIGRVIGRMFAAGACGSIVGTLAAGYLFISWIGSTGTVIAVAGLYGVIALAFAAWSRRLAALAMILVVPIAGLAAWGGALQAFRSPCHVESDYFCIRLDDFSPQSGRPSTLMVLDHLVHSINDRDDPGMIYSPYVHFVDEVTGFRRAGTSQPLDAFFIGGGGYTLPRAWAAVGGHLTVAEIDPAVTRVARQSMWIGPERSGLHIMHQDARVALRGLPPERRFDVVFGDAFHDIAVPAHLVTREFHREIAARLTAHGFYAVNVVDLGSAPHFLLALVRTLRLDFPIVEVWKSFDEIDEAGRVTFIVLAAAAATPTDRLASLRGVPRHWTRWPDAEINRQLAAHEPPVLTDDHAPVDRLMSALLRATEP